MKPIRHTIVTLLFLALVASLSYSLSAEELKPHNVVVRSTFKEEITVPEIKTHQFRFLTPETIQEPYLPDFDFDAEDLPDDFPQNTTLSGLTRFSPSLSRLFRGNTGRLENGIFFYQKGQTGLAERDLRPLLTEKTKLRETATLYLAWIKFRENLTDESLRLTTQLDKGASPAIAKEALYLKTLILFYRHRFQKAVDLYEKQISPSKYEKLDLKHIYLYLASLAKLGYWKEARQVSEFAMGLPISHTRPYYKLLELSALIDYQQKRYTTSLEKYKQVRQLHRHPSLQVTLNRRIAWLQYLTGHYREAVTTLERQINQFSTAYQPELRYLKLACHLQLKEWNTVDDLLNDFQRSSLFYTYSTFQIRTHLKSPQPHPGLFQLVSTQTFDFPEMKFHVALLDGNLFFKNGQFKKSRAAYLRALSVDSNSHDYWKAQFNLGLTRMMLNQHKPAESDFSHLYRTARGDDLDKILYQLAYSRYQLKRPQKTLQALQAMDLQSYSEAQQIELLLIKAGTLLQLDRPESARQIFEEIWSRSKIQASLEFIAKIHYDNQDFKKVLALARANPNHRSDAIVSYEIKSLLALRQFEEAQQVMELVNSQSEAFIELRLKVWTANQRYVDIIDYINGLLRSSLTPERRRYYHLNLGDAYFNLQRYRESKNQFYRALNLTNEADLKSLILYNIALSSYYYQDYTSFLKEVNQVLSKTQISGEVRYNLTLLLAEYYQKSNKIAKADKIYLNHFQNFSYKKADIHIKRIRLWFQNKQYRECVRLGSIAIDSESTFQRRDRIIMFGYCANKRRSPFKVIKTVQAEVDHHQTDYRINELNFILAQAYSHTGEFNRSMNLSRNLVKHPLNSKVRHETQLLITHNLLKTRKPDRAQVELGDTLQYRTTGLYVRALQLKSEIEFQKKRHHKAHRALLRIYYLAGSSETARHLALLRLAEGYLDEGDRTAAGKHLAKIDRTLVSKEPDGAKRYRILQKALGRKS